MKNQVQAPKIGNIEKNVLILKPATQLKKEPATTVKKEDTKQLIMEVLPNEKKEELKPTNTQILPTEKKENSKPTNAPVMTTTPKTEELKSIITSFAPSAEQRIKNAENFKILTTKFEHLKTKSDELNRFKISSDGIKERIYLENAEGFKFEVSNSKIIEETVKLLESTLTAILTETENQVKNFII